MGQSVPFDAPPRLSEAALDALCRQMVAAAEAMSDAQILCVADALHETLRTRRALRHRSHQRVESRLCSDSGTAFPF